MILRSMACGKKTPKPQTHPVLPPSPQVTPRRTNLGRQVHTHRWPPRRVRPHEPSSGQGRRPCHAATPAGPSRTKLLLTGSYMLPGTLVPVFLGTVNKHRQRGCRRKPAPPGSSRRRLVRQLKEQVGASQTPDGGRGALGVAAHRGPAHGEKLYFI